MNSKNRKWDYESMKKVVDFYLLGHTYTECKKEFKICRRQWNKIAILFNLKIKLPSKWLHPTIEEEQEVVNFYLNGNSITNCRSKFHIGLKYLHKILSKYNVILKPYRTNKRLNFDTNYFESIDSEDKAYFLGLLIADGYNSNKQIILSLQEQDKHILEIFIDKLNYTGNLKFRKKESETHQNQYSLVLSSQKICSDLSKLGCIKNKTHFAYFSNISQKLYSHFIRGVFDGDGCICGTNFSITGNNLLIESIQQILVRECNLKNTKISAKENRPKNIVDLNYRGRYQICRIRDYIYRNATIYLNRKHEKFYKISSESKSPKYCTICNKPSKAKGLCGKHYEKKRIDKKYENTWIS
jgi:hypothetical protein